ncbi:MAG: glutathione S-transferase family protein [Gammaproteobacteria bacterium]|jgi:glutathione S-transferase|nr:glutathione S-transferase family protein [Gammaproteobacteria bacterium]MBQ0774300.1 glutathione S-transferase family protein [Gammaproteobacteria bacterium]
MAYTLYGAVLSPFVRKCRVFLAEKDIPFDSVHVDPGALPQEYANLNPLMRIPALEHDGKRFADSAVICQYVERLHPEPALYPRAAADYAQCLWLEKYADYELAPLCTFGIFRQRLIMPLRGLPGDENKALDAINKLPALFDYLEQQLGSNTWFVNDQLTVADIAITSQLVNMQYGGESLNAERWPNLHAHMQRMQQRPSFSNALNQEAVVISKIKAHLNSPAKPAPNVV